MPPLTSATDVRGYEIDEERHSVVLTRHLAASVEQAFALWTDPRHVAHWWDPSGVPLAECSIDLRVGGELRFIGAGSKAPPFVGRYVEIDPPTRLVFEAMGAMGTVTIERHEGGSCVNVEIRAPSAEGLEGLLAVGVAIGTAQTLDNLQAYADLGTIEVVSEPPPSTFVDIQR